MCTNCTGHTAVHGPAHAPVIVVPAAVVDPAAGLVGVPSPAVPRTAASLRASPGLVVAAGNFLPGTVCFLLVSFLLSGLVTLFSLPSCMGFVLIWKGWIQSITFYKFCLLVVCPFGNWQHRLIGSFVIDWVKCYNFITLAVQHLNSPSCVLHD